MKRILWLTSWYPNSSDPFNGDFIKREAEAVSDYIPLKVLFVGKYDRNAPAPDKDYADVISRNQNLEEYILYYPSEGTSGSLLSRFHSLKTYIRLHFDFLKKLRKSREWPDLIHVHVAMKAGLIALYLKFRFGIPYVLTEHWSGYYPVSSDSLYKKSFITRFLTRRIIRNAIRFLPVSEDLGNEVSSHWTKVPFQNIPNVVDTRLFFPPADSPVPVFRFIHVSALLFPKNPEGIIRAFMKLLEAGISAELVIVGPVNPRLAGFIQESGLKPDQLICTGEIPYAQVAAELRKSSALILFSFYENMPCVILEALCCGVPVIATRVGGIPEIITKENGVLINAGRETELLDAMKEMVRNYQQYDLKKISESARRQFSYEVIGKKISDVYQSVTEKK